jgi:peptidoglycan/LPS O-acetylase OafA/YrhL
MLHCSNNTPYVTLSAKRQMEVCSVIRASLRRPAMTASIQLNRMHTRPSYGWSMSLVLTTSPAAPSIPHAPAGAEPRIVALDGLRGLMTLFVLVSHYFGEIEGGLRPFMVGWIAVDMFFVLSGFLVGNLIMDKMHHRNFLTVFYIRRACRTVPVYIGCVLLIFAVVHLLGPRSWITESTIPLWSYLTFTQTFFMAQQNSMGLYWLAPTWTLAVEEHFYLVAPAFLLLTPRRLLIAALMAVILAALCVRLWLVPTGGAGALSHLVLLPARMDTIAIGILAAVMWKRGLVDWARHGLWLRMAPIIAAVVIAALKNGGDSAGFLFNILAGPVAAAGCAGFLLALVMGAPEAARYHAPFLRFFSRTSYSIYLTHVMILCLMHGLLLDAKPAMHSAAQWGVTLAALPLAIGAGYLLTRIFEEPLTAWGRSFKWSAETVERQG